MSDERQSSPLSGSSVTPEIDRELTHLLSIAPSAEFVPRVQQRIHKQAAYRVSRMPSWMRGAVAATVVLAILFGSRLWWTQRVRREVRTVRVTTQLPSIIPPAHQTTAAAPQGPRIAVRRPKRVPSLAAARSDAGSTHAEVMVSRNQLRAIARLQQLIAQGQLTDKNAPPAGGAPDAVNDIRPAPLTVAPLTVSAVEIVTGGEESRGRRLER